MPDSGTVAYCAPGALAVAEQALDAAGEVAADLKEHPWLVGYGGVLLIREPPEWEHPAPFVFTPPPPCGLCGGTDGCHNMSCTVWWLTHFPQPSQPLMLLPGCI